MSNQLTKQADTKLASAQKIQVQLITELENGLAQSGTQFTDYGKKCVINAIGGLLSLCKQNGIEPKQLDPTLLRLQLQNIGLTELNYAAIPSEIYFDLRKIKGGDMYSLAIKPQGAGNEKLVRKYGVGLKENGLLQPWLVRDGDEFSYPQFNGIEMTPPKWIMKSITKKVVMVVYPAIRTDGRVEYLMSARDEVKTNLIAQIRQNALYTFKKDYIDRNGVKRSTTDEEARNQFYNQLDVDAENMSVDELISSDRYYDYINPTYTSGGSKEQMILRKMKNNALKNYPKEYDSSLIKEAVADMFEEHDESLNEGPVVAKKVETDVIEKTEKEINEIPPVEDAPQDFSVENEETENQVDEELVQEANELTEQVSSDEDYGF